MMSARTAAERATFAQPLFGPGMWVVDLGCGPGSITLGLAAESRVAGVDLDAGQIAMARDLARRSGRSTVDFLVASAYDLPFASGSVDVAFSHALFEHLSRPLDALAELRRVLKPGGRLLFIEHVRSDDPKLAKWQDRLLGLNVRMGHGCHCNRATLDGIRAAGFDVADVEHGSLSHAPPLVRPLIAGVATA